jgi:hypothetical protein
MARRQQFSFDEGRNRHDEFETNFGSDYLSPFGNNEDSFETFIPRGGGGGGGGRSSGPVFTPPPPPPPRPIIDILPPPPPPIEEIVPDKPIEGPKLTPIIGGCMDVTALNYNSSATYDNGKCRYRKPTPLPVVNDYNTPVKVNVRLSGKGVGTTAAILVNGKEVGYTPDVLNFTEKELLSPKVITVIKQGYTVVQEYKISTVQRTITTDIKPISEIILPPPPPIQDVIRPDLPPRGGGSSSGGSRGGGSRGGGGGFNGGESVNDFDAIDNDDRYGDTGLGDRRNRQNFNMF